MNRRDFAKSLAAAFAVPALPAKALATPIAAAPVLPPNLYTWGAMLARTKGQISVDLLRSKLSIDSAHAAAVFDKLVANNVVGASNALGLAQANPIVRPRSVLRAGLDHLAAEEEALDEAESAPDEEHDRAEC